MTRILVIEDDSTVRTLLEKVLTSEGFETITAEDGVAGLQMAGAYEPDLILCDVMMPNTNGFSVLTQLRQNAETARIPFIFLTAKDDKANWRQGMDLGADDYLTKPFTRSGILRAIHARLQKQATITQPYLDELKRAAESLNEMAYRDPLTRLPNCILFHQKLQAATLQAKQQQQNLALLRVQVTISHLEEDPSSEQISLDQFIEQAASRLTQLVFADTILGRLSNEEFGILLINLSPEEVEAFAKKLLRTLQAPYNLGNSWIQPKIIIGVALCPTDSDTANHLLHQSSLACQHKNSGSSSSYQFYTPEMELWHAEQRLLSNYLPTALKQSQFKLFYQPQIKVITGRILGMEAFLRWKHPELGWISPEKFLPIAEQTGMIIELGDWILRTACSDAKNWQDSSHVPLQVSVNLSACQFNHPDFVSKVATILAETKLEPERLVLELTEASLMENPETTNEILQALKALGVQISVDDFGTGFSSLNHLKRFPIDILKIDQSFVKNITQQSDDAAIAKTIIAIAQSMQLKVIAEGVETKEQQVFLRQNGCYAMQGHLFSLPIASANVYQLIDQLGQLEGSVEAEVPSL